MLYLFFIFGLVGLWFSADIITKGALGIARKLNWSETFTGVTILALGTGLPEVIVSLTGAFDQSGGVNTAGLVIGNIMGSTIGNISLVLGLAGLLKILAIDKKELISSGSVMIAAVLAFWWFVNDGFLSPIEGLYLLIGYCLYLIFISNNERKHSKLISKYIQIKLKKRDKHPIWWFIIELMIGFTLIASSSQLVLTKGLMIVEVLHVNQMLVGIFMIGLGTSLPELVVSLNAVLNRSSGLSVGNLIGSNIVDILLALGLSATVNGWHVVRGVYLFDLPFLLVTSIIIFLFLLTRKKMEKKESILVLFLYLGYILLKLQGF